jgi:hypothetical protein
MELKLFDNKVYEKHSFYSFAIMPHEDIHLLIDSSLETDKGQWIIKHCKEHTIEQYKFYDVLDFKIRITIVAFCTPEDWTFYLLKF